MSSPLQKSLSFISKVPPEAPPYADAQNGALNFTATMGKAFGRKVLKLNTLYNDSGGSFTGFEAPADEWNFCMPRWSSIPGLADVYQGCVRSPSVNLLHSHDRAPHACSLEQGCKAVRVEK